MMKLLKYLKPFAFMAVSVVILILLQSLAELALPSLMADIVDKGIAKGDIGLIWRTGGLMLAAALGGALCSVASGYLSARVSTGYGKTLRHEVFSHVESLSLHEFETLGTSSLITRTTNDINHVQMVTLMMLRIVLSAPMMFVGGIIMAVSKDPKLSLMLIGTLPVLAGSIWYVSAKGMPLFKALQEKLDKLNLVLREGLTGIRVIRAFDRVDYETGRFDEANLDLTQTAVRVNRIMATLWPVMMLTLNFTTIAIIWFGSHRIDAGNLEVGGLMAFIQYAMQILMSLLMVSSVFVMLPRASASAERINEVLTKLPEQIEPESSGIGGPCRGHLEFQDVTFTYPGAEEPAVSGVSFQANPGETTAIIGGTGSGKSTLIGLIPRFYEIDSGRILINETDVGNMPLSVLRNMVGLVPQKAVLFTGTVADNIRYGKADATNQEIEEALETAQATDFVSRMEGGINAFIAQGGKNLSGGQKQRMSIARALVRKPKIYIFDDSFSALDYRTGARLQAALKKETEDRTVLIVTQRAATAMNADRIIVLDKGTVAGYGTHRELLKTCEIYREIVSSQLSEEEIA